MTDTIISVKDLSFSYPNGAKALKNINFDVERGEFIVIMGPNGAGKSTLCMTMNGIVPNVVEGEKSGIVTVCGLKTDEHPVYELAQKVGMALQDPETQILCPDVETEVAFGPENLGIPREEIIERTSYVLKAVRLEGMLDRSPNEMSGGQKQRLALAAVLAMRPDVLVLDEPTSQMDPIGSTEVLSVVRDLNKKYGVTIVMAEHKSEEVAEIADRIILLNDGEMIASGDPHEVFSKIDLLDKIEVKVPPVTRLGFELRKKGFKIDKLPITLQEAVADIPKPHKRRAHSTQPAAGATAVSEEGRSPILETRNLSHTYPGNVLALKDINVRIYDGEFVGIIGQNGAGKTTLVKHFVGLLKPTTGQVLVYGDDSKKFTTGEIAKRVGLILQNPDHQLFALSVKEEVEFGPKNLLLSKEEIDKRVDSALKSVGLENSKNVYPLRLSFADRRKLTVAAVLAMEPKIIILDEPTTAQDYKGRYEITDLAKNLNDKGHTVIMITHDMDLVAKYAKRTVVMGLGEILLDGPTEEVFSQTGILEKTYLKPPQITQLAQTMKDHGVPNVLSVEGLLSSYGGA
ncbi:MAG TPA: energy-coupling factor transporter ATPase [Candidatus Bathyarchaeia archaeon]|nr:MAG: hypothetical protein A3K70_03735 [Candidatus Bathyarchaeota archaeon RBG_16_48_13]HJX24115.1 energy-coupling factor transporter ATPase [Candidatus Bathyarchaeia archaeon]